LKLYSLLLLTALAVPASAAPVHVSLKSMAAISANADGFFTLASVADLTGGDASQRTRLAAIPVGRAPLSGETRCLTQGDLALKLRQAGCDPDKDVALEGARETTVTTVGAGLAPALPSGPVSGQAENSIGRAGASPTPTQALPAISLLHPGSPVTILIQSGPLSITAPGIARESGGVAGTIRVHREGVMTDLTVTVLDAQTVRLEI